MWIWQFLRKFDYFWALLYWQHWLQKTEAQFCNQCYQYKYAQKESNFLKKCQIHAKDVQGKIEFFIKKSDSTLQVCMKFVFIDTCLVYLDSYWITDKVDGFYFVISPMNCCASFPAASIWREFGRRSGKTVTTCLTCPLVSSTVLPKPCAQWSKI